MTTRSLAPKATFRKVGPDGIRWRGLRYSSVELTVLVGETVEVRRAAVPSCLGIYVDNELVATARCVDNRVANERVRQTIGALGCRLPRRA